MKAGTNAQGTTKDDLLRQTIEEILADEFGDMDFVTELQRLKDEMHVENIVFALRTW